jgi:16S rRNA (guanine527-N7)-methyltransferase
MDDRGEFARRFDLPDAAMRRLDRYAAAVARWNSRINLFAPGAMPELWSRHIGDGVRVAEALPAEGPHVCDLGSGGGVPGLVVAAVRPDLDVALYEADARKCAFLREASREMGLPVRIVRGRIEELRSAGADFVTARALAPLPLLLAYCHQHVDRSGLSVLLKGRNWADEVEAARVTWSFDLETTEVEGGGAVLKLRKLVPR